MYSSETIAAIATPLGQGGIGIIRISGPRSLEVGRSLFRSARSGFLDFRPYTLHHGWIVDSGGEPVDEVLASFMPAPGSYTGEDVLEINCHGGPAAVRYILELALRSGARIAEPGEFTLRAFLNGRMDLTRAESVAEMVQAPTRPGLGMAAAKLSGRLEKRIAGLRERLEDLRSRFTAAMDFPEEEEGEETSLPELSEVLDELEGVESDICELVENFRRHHCLREGVPVVLAGRVNAGKSSLLNAVLGRTRALVDPQPGTTRDYLEEVINLQGIPVRLTDIAGLREVSDRVEQAGLQRGREIISEATLVCLVFDQSLPLDEETKNAALELGSEKILAVGNKADLASLPSGTREWFHSRGFECLSLSAQTGEGVEELLERMRRRILGEGAEPQEGELVPNLRQQEKLNQALEEISQLKSGLESLPEDVLGTHLEAASRHLAELTGEISTEDVLERVFSSFCIGK